MKSGRILKKTRKFFLMTIREQTARGVCFMNERQQNTLEHELKLFELRMTAS